MFWLSGIFVTTSTQRDGCYKKKLYYTTREIRSYYPSQGDKMLFVPAERSAYLFLGNVVISAVMNATERTSSTAFVAVAF